MELLFQSFRKWLDFSGRSNRAPYVVFVLAVFIGLFVCRLIDVHVASPAMGRHVSYYSYLFSLVVFIPLLSLSIRRLHDLNYSGWFVLLFGVPLPYVYYVLLFLLMIMPGTTGRNRYGDPVV